MKDGMEDLIENFSQQIEEALTIGENFSFTSQKKQFQNVVICGLGGSGIGASFVKDALFAELTIPLVVVKGYFLPKFVSENTLLIISSYSGNTEETLACFEEALHKKCTIVSNSSNGQVLKISKENKIDCIIIPGGMPPRACLAYSTVQLFFILHFFDLIDDTFKKELTLSISLLKTQQASIKAEANQLAKNIFNKIPIIYSSDHIESLAIRWRQQINENGKMLCWHHVVPEMNHNELVGWREKNDQLAIIFLRNDNDYEKIQQRIKLNKQVYELYTPNIFEIWSKGTSFIQRAMYLTQFGDYVSLYLSHLRGFETTEVRVIDELKANLK